ncbi:TadE/TadG family type IV pilus assembly protein [Kitasatospora sp. CM 4170]|uniref:TadE/TadG family type IV pilus assembly protein n=1 Tax=Kitasatospora aburaviensis TaxID=67265 RepID=A0ABW1ENU8_9ACTN|nr:TadE/TadG family type IV pilus assembly protein [Kitasatospora sp. CM 4170]WNM48695.1 TadE/TadG family type IV pilus assembly protein [Kitasatospora sp. CM 4170]
MSARARTAGWAGRLAARRAARSAHGRDAGGVAIEAAIVAPAVVALILATVAAGRVQTAAGTVESAARSAARTASLARSVDGMDDVVKKAAADTMRQQGVACRDWDADVKHGELVTHGAPLVTVEVTVVCEVPLNDLLPGPGMPWTKRLTGRFVSVVDRYRGG